MLFGEVVELYRVEGGFGDAFGAVGDGCLADEGSDAAGGALVEVGGVAGESAGFVLFEVEGALSMSVMTSRKGWRVPWRAGREPQVMRVVRPASWAPRVPVNRGVSVSLMLA
ncbi:MULTISPECIES: hypothetical protein [Streptomyces]|uniref:hypothetical protein n=1 Tax=Streptomyces TaxID=1883 RepID=UPI0038659074